MVPDDGSAQQIAAKLAAAKEEAAKEEASNSNLKPPTEFENLQRGKQSRSFGIVPKGSPPPQPPPPPKLKQFRKKRNIAN
tara:strand:- start:902 stop:1141 length:240 start_codon:yes stop_codon:yes gene_type:complete